VIRTIAPPIADRCDINARVGLAAGLCAALAWTASIANPPAAPSHAVENESQRECLPDSSGFLRARLTGAIHQELDWHDAQTECTGALRPTDGGVRMRFSHPDGDTGHRLALVFGIANLREGQSARSLPVNVTVMREGAGEFYSTQGDDKCMFDTIEQTPLVGVPHRSRSYRVEARGYCTEPARAVGGKGVVLLSRFDFAGRIDFESVENDSSEPRQAASRGPKR
jgi:hypothetical protein